MIAPEKATWAAVSLWPSSIDDPYTAGIPDGLCGRPRLGYESEKAPFVEIGTMGTIIEKEAEFIGVPLVRARNALKAWRFGGSADAAQLTTSKSLHPASDTSTI
jgi:hypothetical protein